MSNDPTEAGGIHITHIGDRHPDVEEAEQSPWIGVRSHDKEVPVAVPEIKMMALKDHMGETGGLLKGDPAGENGALYTLHSEKTAFDHVALGLGKRLSPEPKPEEPPTGKPEPDAPWSEQLSPEQYLDKYPNGPNADQARATIEKAKAANPPAKPPKS